MTAGKILIVDDQVGIRLLLSEILESEGYELFEASNGIEAIHVAEQEKPDIILLDMKLPGMNGLEILSEFHEKGISSAVVMMTAYGESELIDEAERLGALGFLSKPFDIQDLTTKMASYFEKVAVTKQPAILAN